MDQNILVISGDSNWTKLLSNLREKSQLTYEIVSEAANALDMVKEKNYNIIITNLKLENMSGLDFLSKLNQLNINVPVIIVTKYTDFNSVRIALKKGAEDYITTPLNDNELLSSINTILDEKENNEVPDIKNRNMAKDNNSKIKELNQKINMLKRNKKDEYFSNLLGLTKIIENRYEFLQGHSKEVTDLSVNLARKLGFDKEKVIEIKIAALFHDIGKIGLPDKILKTSKKLSEEEFNIVKMHPVNSVNILKNFINEENILKIVKHHHERMDGTGYPNRLSGEDIPIGSKIIFTVNAYVSMTSERPFRKDLSKDKAIRELKENIGLQFDENIVNNLLKII